MDALIPRREKAEELNDYQKRLIVSVALKQSDGYPKRAERLKKIEFCTDAVKFEVLRNEPKINAVLYAELHRLYFSEANRSETPQRSSAIQGPGWKEIEAKPRALTEDEVRRLIELYNAGTKPREMGEIFHRTPNAISSLIYAYKHQDRYKELFKMDKEKAAPKPQEHREAAGAKRNSSECPESLHSEGQGLPYNRRRSEAGRRADHVTAETDDHSEGTNAVLRRRGDQNNTYRAYGHGCSSGGMRRWIFLRLRKRLMSIELN